MNTRKSTVALTLVGSLVLGFAGGSLGAATTNLFGSDTDLVGDSGQVQQTQIVEEGSQTIDAIEKVQPAVVSIVATRDLQIVRRSPSSLFNPFMPVPQEAPQVETQRQQVSGGSGFIVSADGLVLTNKHVVRDEDADYSVVLNNGEEYTAEVVSRDPANDLAVIQILEGEDKSKPKDLPIVEFGESDNLKIGQKVIAIGNALGEFQNTVTSGIVSAISRQIEASDSMGGNRDVLTNLLQTDAAINAGNSGGPLINLSGQVVGVNTAIASGANGIGFAIPIDDVKPVVSSVKEFGEIVRPQLGVRYVLLSKTNAENFEIDVDHGAYLAGNDSEALPAVLKDSPADKAGLQAKDVILEVDGKEINETFGLQEAIRNKKPDDKVNLTIWRDGKSIEKTVTLEAFEPQK
ncbi:hypothetical protein COV81_04755 [Candidatus Peregrinibacteria bacterium CG11_big_fil_rev_8_21_14_0_20_41_10]|nr:MAG: hypothetical protein COV81_04755 [Candidatus Peregrinibacteria bacterium CG11_big_fil_rev_8_21_14_0_20_41_10]PJC37899.1 MAG: hypothetical protein CO045_03075 [Candidatus Peregrinibacteria bacterium CG_4_9_14_0_2_um_filter_41_14]